MPENCLYPALEASCLLVVWRGDQHLSFSVEIWPWSNMMQQLAQRSSVQYSVSPAKVLLRLCFSNFLAICVLTSSIMFKRAMAHPLALMCPYLGRHFFVQSDSNISRACEVHKCKSTALTSSEQGTTLAVCSAKIGLCTQ